MRAQPTEDPGTGLVTLGRHLDLGDVSRDDVAAVMLALLDPPRPGAVLGGRPQLPIGEAVADLP